MSRSYELDGTPKPKRPSDHECRVKRLRTQRRLLAHDLEVVLACRSDVRRFSFKGLGHLGAYAALEREGLAHATAVCASGSVTILAATTRVLKKEDLRERLFAVRRLAEAGGQRVVIATSKGLRNEIARRRLRRSPIPDQGTGAFGHMARRALAPGIAAAAPTAATR